MKRLRSILFVFLFNFSTLIQMIFWLPAFFIVSRENGWKIVRLWGLSQLWLQHYLIGNTYDFRGLENLPDHGAIIASKHQSTWETFATLLFIRDPSYILKRELMFVPLFGWFAAKMAVIPVNRGKRSEALKKMAKATAEQLTAGRQIIIYPEGTRKLPFAEPAYKYGVVHLYEKTNADIVPVALNSGLFWARNSVDLHRGRIVMEFLPPITPGLTGDTFSNAIEASIETKTNELMQEAMSDPDYDGPKRESV